MIDELDLAFDEQAERGKPRHRRGARGKDGEGKSGGKSTVAFLMAFILLDRARWRCCFGYNKVPWLLHRGRLRRRRHRPRFRSLIKERATLTEMGNILVDLGCGEEHKGFHGGGRGNPIGKKIQPGTYKLRKQMRARPRSPLLLDPENRVTTASPSRRV